MRDQVGPTPEVAPWLRDEHRAPPDVDEFEGRQVEVDAACRRPPIGVSDHADDDRLEEAPGGDVDFALPRATMGPSV